MDVHLLFLGIILDQLLLNQLNHLSNPLQSTFVGTDAYLQQIEWEGKIFLGKNLGDSFDLSQLDQMEAHLLSLLQKLFPENSFEKSKLLLFSYQSK